MLSNYGHLKQRHAFVILIVLRHDLLCWFRHVVLVKFHRVPALWHRTCWRHTETLGHTRVGHVCLRTPDSVGAASDSSDISRFIKCRLCSTCGHRSKQMLFNNCWTMTLMLACKTMVKSKVVLIKDQLRFQKQNGGGKANDIIAQGVGYYDFIPLGRIPLSRIPLSRIL